MKLMRLKTTLILAVVFFPLLCPMAKGDAPAGDTKARYLIVASDTLLAGMAEALAPSHRYSVKTILPPGQCPGHYDVKLSDIEKVQKADLVLSFRGMPFMGKVHAGSRNGSVIDNDGKNWMAPDFYIMGLNRMADELALRFPVDRNEILQRKEAAVRLIRDEAKRLRQKAEQAGLPGRAVLASSLQKDQLEWMGLRVAGVYGRPESLSARDVVRLVRTGREERVIAVVDNLQSGPDAGKGIAASLSVPHLVLTNFPSEKGYLATLGENVDVLAAAVQ
ncbi:MAG: hypothetical protein C0394_01905 [Syntrophus sp. (in: bacteria)]|nr:hypothetical protein [Syntrophus sp. (in: bacteria)]